MQSATMRVLTDVGAERERQTESLGYDPDHDDRRTPDEWAWLIARRVSNYACPGLAGLVTPTQVRAELVQIAALAVAAIEAHDRNAPPAAPSTFAAVGPVDVRIANQS
jgi:hypothetical protein